MTTATVLSGGLTGGTMVENGVTYYLWGFTVNVDGQVYGRHLGLWGECQQPRFLRHGSGRVSGVTRKR